MISYQNIWMKSTYKMIYFTVGVPQEVLESLARLRETWSSVLTVLPQHSSTEVGENDWLGHHQENAYLALCCYRSIPATTSQVTADKRLPTLTPRLQRSLS